MKRDNPDHGITEEELSSSEDETESDFENLVCPSSSGEKYTCDERTFLVYESSLRELLASYARGGSRINHNLIAEIKNTGSQLTLHIEWYVQHSTCNLMPEHLQLFIWMLETAFITVDRYV